jgi:hypothetical protein
MSTKHISETWKKLVDTSKYIIKVTSNDGKIGYYAITNNAAGYSYWEKDYSNAYHFPTLEAAKNFVKNATNNKLISEGIGLNAGKKEGTMIIHFIKVRTELIQEGPGFEYTGKRV